MMNKTPALLIVNGLVIDPGQGIEAQRDVLLRNVQKSPKVGPPAGADRRRRREESWTLVG